MENVEPRLTLLQAKNANLIGVKVLGADGSGDGVVGGLREWAAEGHAEDGAVDVAFLFGVVDGPLDSP